MRYGGLITSRFRSVYVGLVVLFVASTMIIHILSLRYVRPWLENRQMADIESLIRSHEERIHYNDTRALRDELVAKNIIASDLNYSILKPSTEHDKALLTDHLKNCKFLRSRSCLSSDGLVILSADHNESSLASYNYAILLETRLSTFSSPVIAGEIAGVMVFAIVFLIIGLGIRKQEQVLLGKIALFSKSLENVESLFLNTGTGEKLLKIEDDEFSSASQTIDELGAELKNRTKTVEEFKMQFERKTRLEQLGLTVGQVSHDLKAPFNEAEQFLSLLPGLLNSVPNMQIIEMSNSLRDRIAFGKKALDQALKTTSIVSTATEKVDLGELLKSLSRRYNSQAIGSGFRVSLIAVKNLFIAGDRNLLERAFLNLIQNSFEARVDGTLNISLDTDALNSICLSFIDNGPGICGEHLESIFGPLVSFKTSGTGFGLSSCKEIIEKCQGTIAAMPCESGAHFRIIFPEFKNENIQELGALAYV